MTTHFLLKKYLMKQLSIDIETYSSTNLNQTGVYHYVM